jgi:hypothetical protein
MPPQVLTCSAEAYAAMQRVNLSSYRPISLYESGSNYLHTFGLIEDMAKKLNCEVVVDLRPVSHPDHNHYQATSIFATGLIRKTQDDETEIGDKAKTGEPKK